MILLEVNNRIVEETLTVKIKYVFFLQYFFRHFVNKFHQMKLGMP